MRKMIGVSATDQIVVDEEGRESRIIPGDLMQMVWDNSLHGIPLILEHDYNYLIGWSKNYGLHIEPGIARCLTITEIIETHNEQRELIGRFNRYYTARIKFREPEFEKLRQLIEKYLDRSEVPYEQDCICYFRKDLAKDTFPELFSKVDRYGLISVNHLEPIGLGIYKIGDLSVFAHRFFRRSSSIFNSLNFPFLHQLNLLDSKSNDIRIRLDPDMVGLVSSYRQSFERTYWWGPLFDDDLVSIPPGETEYIVGERKTFNSLIRTDFRWKDKKNYHEFEAEEVFNDPPAIHPSINNIDYFGYRYVHSIIKNDSDEVHFDGALRLYTENEIHGRVLKKLSNSGHKTQYFKLWRIDGKIQVKIWKRLLSDYFRDNYLVGEYLSGKDYFQEFLKQDNIPEKETKTNHIDPEIQFSFSLHPWNYHKLEEREVFAILNIEKKIPSEFKEYFDKRSLILHLPKSIEITTNYGDSLRLPLIIHNENHNQNIIETTIEIIAVFANKLKNDSIVKKFGYNIGFKIQDFEVRISILGNMQDITEWLNENVSKPKLTKADFVEWINKITLYLEQKYPGPYTISDIFKSINPSGIL